MAEPATDVLFTGTGSGPLACSDADGRVVHRVGYAPNPWAWTPWQYATDGRFGGRWDDPDGLWRTLYAGGSRLACYLEVLAVFRPDLVLSAELESIDETPQDAADHPMLGLGQLPRAWLEPRRLGTAILRGWYAVPGGRQSLPTLRARFWPWPAAWAYPIWTAPRSAWPNPAG